MWFRKHFRREKKEFAQQSFQDIKQIRTCLPNYSKKNFKKSKDPPRSRSKPLLWKLLKEFKFTKKDNFILSSYGEASLRAALEDYKFYLSLRKRIDNPVAFLISRCKYHRKKLTLEPQKTLEQKFKEFMKKAILLHEKGTVKFIQKEFQPKNSDRDKIYIRVREHKKNAEKSILYLWKRVNGYWVDKRIAFKHECFEELVEPFLA